MELETLCRVHSHELQRRSSFSSLRLARFQRGVGEKGGQRIHRWYGRRLIGIVRRG